MAERQDLQFVDDMIKFMNETPRLRRRKCMLPGTDSPWLENPIELKWFNRDKKEIEYRTVIEPSSHREARQANKKKVTEFNNNKEKTFIGINGIMCPPPSIDLGSIQGSDSDIEEQTERYFVNHAL